MGHDRNNFHCIKSIGILITLLAAGLFSYTGFSQHRLLEFERISIEEGLSQSSVNSIYKDKTGFIWVGTAGGLNRYDGVKFKVFNTGSRGKHSLTGNYVKCVYQDRDGIFWIGTIGGGIDIFNPSAESFERLKLPFNSDGVERIFSIIQSSDGKIYFGTEGAGVILFDKKKKDFKNVTSRNKKAINYPERNSVNTLLESDGRVFVATMGGIQVIESDSLSKIGEEPHKAFSFFKDKNETIWVGTDKGLGRLTQVRGVYSLDFPFPALSGVSITSVADDGKDNLWLATLGRGLAILNKSSGNIQYYSKKFNDPSSISSNDVNIVYRDNAGIMWIGTTGGGICKYDEMVDKFASFQSEYTDNLNCLLEDSEGKIWYSTNSKGVSYYDPITKEEKNYPNEGLVQRFLCEDVFGNIWGTTPFKSLNKFSKSTGKFEIKSFLASGYVIISGSDGKIYLPTFDGALKIIDPGTEKMETIPYSKNLSKINCIFEGKENIWMGDNDGVIGFYNKASKKISDFKLTYRGNEIKSRIRSIFQDKSGKLFCGTSLFGVFEIDPERPDSIKRYDNSNGLPGNEINGILADESGTIWVSTSNGLAAINTKNGNIKTYTKEDGLLSNEFNTNVHLKGRHHYLYFGGTGFNYFQPEKIKENRQVPPVVITDFKLFNKSVPVREEEDSTRFVLEKPIHLLDEIKLSYNQNVMAFEFSSLNFSLPTKNKFMYKMEGFDKDWVNAGINRQAFYTNLDAGRYTFLVKGSNNDGVFNPNPAHIRIYIAPPLWQTWWAYLLYCILAASLIFAGWRYFSHREKLKNELEIKNLESKKLKELDTLKNRFYTNVSHEFKTPLTLILAPIEAALNTPSKQEANEKLKVVQRNAKRLLDLINQLLDVSKLESGNMKWQFDKGDIIHFIKVCTAAFSSLAATKGIELKFTTSSSGAIVMFDKDKIEKIVNNLISNAIKFSREGGLVEVICDADKSGITLEVRDTGIGIPEDKCEEIFERYYHIENQTDHYEGTGIGLALLKELVLLHKGTIELKSKVNEGSTFTVKIPLKIEETSTSVPTTSTFEKPALASASTDLSDFATGKKEGKDDKPLILVVEDNDEVRAFVVEVISKDYNVMEAANGKDGLTVAEAAIPDLIISDVMMPKMDGVQFIGLLKTNEKTSHIPVILLTAKSSQEHRLEGLETGADDYLTKPFHLEELKVRVKNLIQQRELLRKRFAREVTLQPKDIAITPADEVFLNRCVAVIETNISNSDFTVEEFGKEVGMSRSQLHRKLKALTDQSSSEFIRNIKLKRAAELLKQNFGNTSQVAYEVGFDSVSYFIKCFKEVYGKTPSEFS